MNAQVRLVLTGLSVLLLPLLLAFSLLWPLEPSYKDTFSLRGDLISLPDQFDGDWTQVCILTPYTDSEASQALLKLLWDSDRHTRIGDSDDIVVFVFVDQQKVWDYAQIERKQVRLTQETPYCIERNWAHLWPVHGAYEFGTYVFEAEKSPANN